MDKVFSAIEFWIDRNDSNGFFFLIINTEPNTTDTTPRHERDMELQSHLPLPR